MTNLLTHYREIDRTKLSGMLADDSGRPLLEIRLTYSKDARPRGLKLAIYRILRTEFGHSCDIMNTHNKSVHVADMARKPSAKVEAAWVDAVSGKLDAIAAIALASDAPDWSAVKALFAEVEA